MLKLLLHKRVLRLAALLTLTLSALLPSQLSAQSFTSEGFSYKILDENNRTVEISGLADSGYGSGSLILPETVIDNSTGVTYTLVKIGSSAFESCFGFSGTLTIPNSVTTIGSEAFYGCGGFSGTLTIPNSVTTIGSEAFYGCSGFTGSLTIPNSVTSIGDYAFYYCRGFTGSLTIPNSVTTIGSSAFSGCKGFTSITIPNSVTTIGESAFEECISLTSIIIPNSVTTIGDFAFSGCSSLTSISIPNSVTTIGDYAFSYCSSLTSITIPNSVTTIGERAFNGCSSLTSINVNAANQAYSSKDGVLYNKDQTSLIRYPQGKLGEVIIPNSVTTIGERAFSGCKGFTSITIPNSVTTIGYYAFELCSSLTSITIPNSVTTIGDFAFSYCSSLTSISIPNSVTTIGDFAFELCSSLTSISIPNSVTTIGAGAFNGCSSLTSINVNAANQAYSSKDGVLYNKDQTSLIRCPEGKLGEVIIPNSVTTIWKSAFELCSSLTSITIPNSVTTIGYYAFFGCSSLTSVTSLAVTPPECGVSAFSSVDTDNCTLYVPAKSIQAYKQASEWKEFVKIETVEDAGIDDIPVDGDGMQSGQPDDIYNLQGICIKRNATQEDIDALAPGLYIIGGKKVRVK